MKPQSRPGCNPGGGSFAPGWSLYSLPGLFSVHRHRAAHSGAQPTPGRWTAQPPRVQSRRHTEGQPRHNTRPQPGQATEPRNRARGTGIQASTKTGHRAAHRPENRKPPETAFTATQSHATPPGVFLYYHSRKSPTEPPGAGVLFPILPAAKTPHRGAQSRPQRASLRGCKNTRNAAALAPAYFTTLKC